MIQQKEASRSSSREAIQSPQLFRPTSPHFQGRSQKLYSFNEVREWCDKMMESKFMYLNLEIAENTQTIRKLNERLNHNERELERKERLLAAFQEGKHMQVSLHQSSGQARSGLVSEAPVRLTQAQLEEKLASINNLLRETQTYRQIRPVQHSIEGYQLQMQSWIDTNINRIKQYIKQKCQSVKKHNSQYWQKIRGWLVLFEEKLKRCEGAIETVYDSTQSMGFGDEFMEIYRLRNYHVRFREIEEAVVDMEEMYKLAVETQEEMRGIFWERDQADFLQGKQISEIAENYRPDQEDDQIGFKTNVAARGSMKERFANNLEAVSPLPNRNSLTKEIESLDMMDFEGKHPSHDEAIIVSSQSLPQTQSIQSPNEPQPSLQAQTLLRERITNMITEHKLTRPVQCYLDEYKYLKSDRDTYLFDQLGEMIKMPSATFSKFCRDGLLKPHIP